MTDEIIIRLDENVKFLKEQVLAINIKLDDMEKRNEKADSNFKLLLQSVSTHQEDDNKEFTSINGRMVKVEGLTEQYKNDRAKIIGGAMAGGGLIGWLTSLFK